MKNIRVLLPLLSVLLFMATCKKKEITPSTTVSSPFYFNGTVNGATTNIQAGVGEYELLTSDTLDGNGVYNLTGELKLSNCTSNCPNSLKISIKDYRQYSVLATTVDTSVVQGYYSFATPAGKASQFSVQFFDSLYNGTALSYLWHFGDSLTSNADRPAHIYSHPGIYPVSLNTQSTASCVSSLNGNAAFGQIGGYVQVSFNAITVPGTDSLNVYSTPGGGVKPYSYRWNFGDGNTINTGTVPVCHYKYVNPGVYLVTLTRTDAVNTVEVSYFNVGILPITTCYCDFYPTLITPIANPNNLADVVVEWRDAGGNLYTSNNNSQPFNSMFKILSVTNYQNNSSGQPTKMIHASVVCTVYNGTNSMLINGDVTFAVAY